ncbi:hypothetical protein GYMC10_2712 [Paenibacillus sp. Y412MC10]|nr:hypothetical protein GYMC10_2712 [Paenibacillus sp. Y412MC10]
MMGRIILTMQTTMDGIVSNEDQWMTLNEEIFEDYLEYYNTIDTIIIGSNSYSSLAQHWQNAENSSNDDLERAIAKRINAIPKFVISSTKMELTWINSQQILVNGENSMAHEIEMLKNREGNISVESGVRTWQLFIQHDLFDDLWLFIHPVIVSQGERLFALANKRFTMNLNSSKTYGNGVLGLYYSK